MVVYGQLRKAQKRVKNATIHDYEIEVYEIHKVGDLTESVPFTVYDAENINRDQEDAEDEEGDGDGEDVSLFSGSDTPSGSKSPITVPRSSADLSRIPLDKLDKFIGSRSEYRPRIRVFGLLT